MSRSRVRIIFLRKFFQARRSTVIFFIFLARKFLLNKSWFSWLKNQGVVDKNTIVPLLIQKERKSSSAILTRERISKKRAGSISQPFSFMVIKKL